MVGRWIVYSLLGIGGAAVAVVVVGALACNRIAGAIKWA
jgi:hypothetical protein